MNQNEQLNKKVKKNNNSNKCTLKTKLPEIERNLLLCFLSLELFMEN